MICWGEQAAVLHTSATAPVAVRAQLQPAGHCSSKDVQQHSRILSSIKAEGKALQPALAARRLTIKRKSRSCL